MKPTAWPDFEDVRGARLLVALSGGADSTALLAMLVSARKRLELHLAAAHVNHSIRGPESRADAEFCEKLCRELNVDFYLKNVDVPAAADASHEGIETVARRLRYDALREVRAQTRSDWIVLAHHRDDQAETVLMHLLRGCGGRGIGGMDKFSGDLYRPLLNVSKAELERFLLERGMRWREDSTNAVPDTPRNALRLNVLPLLEQSYPQAARAIARYAQIARREDRLLDEMTDAFLQDRLERVPCGLRLNRPEETDEAILHRALQKLLGESASFDKIDELCAFMPRFPRQNRAFQRTLCRANAVRALFSPEADQSTRGSRAPGKWKRFAGHAGRDARFAFRAGSDSRLSDGAGAAQGRADRRVPARSPKRRPHAAHGRRRSPAVRRADRPEDRPPAAGFRPPRRPGKPGALGGGRGHCRGGEAPARRRGGEAGMVS